MSILIKGLTMPRGDKALVIVINSNGTIDRPNWQWDCTLIRGAEAISIPEHGDLVDIDAMLDDFAELRDYDFASREYVVIPAERGEE